MGWSYGNHEDKIAINSHNDVWGGNEKDPGPVVTSGESSYTSGHLVKVVGSPV